jgi:hypothetical protein
LALAALKATLSDRKLVTAFLPASTVSLQVVVVAADQNKLMEEMVLLVAAPDIMVVAPTLEEAEAVAAMVEIARAPVVVVAQLDQPEMAAMVYHLISPALQPLPVVVAAAEVIKDLEPALAALAAAEPADAALPLFPQPALMVMVVVAAAPVKR